MENASKALIIAGAVIISILLIGLGVGIYQMAKNASDGGANLDSQAAQAQNSQFENVFGPKKSAADVKNLMTLVRNNNITASNNDETKKIWVCYNGDFTDPNKISTSVSPGKTYNVRAGSETDPYGGTDITNAPNKADAEKSGGYYTNGYLRIIVIDVNEGSAKESPAA